MVLGTIWETATYHGVSTALANMSMVAEVHFDQFFKEFLLGGITIGRSTLGKEAEKESASVNNKGYIQIGRFSYKCKVPTR